MCAVLACTRPATTCGYCDPCWIRMDAEGIPIDEPDERGRWE